MKISNIKIRNYHQFKNLALDLTYPEGHQKAGQPLDKVCIIGQSGTGKTSLLRLCRAIIENDHLSADMTDIVVTSHLGGLKRIATIKDGKLTPDYPDKNTTLTMRRDDGEGHIAIKPDNYANEEELFNDYYQEATILIYFPATLTTFSLNILKEGNGRDFEDFIGLKNNKKVQSQNGTRQHKFFDFTYNAVFELWNTSIIRNLKEYRNRILQFNQKVTKALEKGVAEAELALNEFKAWKQNTVNPILPYAEKLNRILNEFCLEVNTDFTYESEEDITFIEIKHRAGTEVPLSGWSTGSLQVILTATPLLQLNTKRVIILMDEPETSLFPDIQEKMISFYTELAPQAQFFFATHSPIIASCFEPWEVVELRFDENGYVFRKEYFDEFQARHVDNYTIDPRYLRWDSILKKLFDVNEEGNRTRITGLMELAKLKGMLRKLKQQAEVSAEIRAELWQKYERVAELVDWKLDAKDR